LDIVRVDVHKSAEVDLERLWAVDPDAAATIAVVLQELTNDPATASSLLRHGDATVGPNDVNVKRWQAAKEAKAWMWRFRILNTPATSYRVVYASLLLTRQIVVLAVVHKDDFDYELDSDLGRRILADWRGL
jgi:hypothetical protein